MAPPTTISEGMGGDEARALKQVDELFTAALERQPEERAASWIRPAPATPICEEK